MSKLSSYSLFFLENGKTIDACCLISTEKNDTFVFTQKKTSLPFNEY